MYQAESPLELNDILLTKLQRPPTRRQMVNRSKLVERLDKGQNKKLCLVSAPAGFGKTTLVSQWAGSSNRLVAWLSLDERDNDFLRFFTYLIESIRMLFPHVGQGLLRVIRSPQMPQLHSIIDPLINELDVLQRSFTLVIDDYHLINNPSIHEGLGLLVAQMPFHMNLTIISRDIPKLPLSKLRAKNQLEELCINDLRFSKREAELFINETMGLNLTAMSIAELDKRTEGWAVGLQLAALSIQNQKGVNALVESFSGGHSYVMDYLIDEVISQLPEHIHWFLMATSILDRFSGSLCDAMMADILSPLNESGQSIIAYLERKNLFIIPLDHERCWYRYHHLFSDLLKVRLEKIQLSANDNIISELHLRASEWYEKNHFILEAFYHAIEAGDIERGSKLVEDGGVPLLYQGGATSILKWLESLSFSTLDQKPFLRVLYASGQLFVGKLGEVEKNLLLAESAINRLPVKDQSRNLLGHISAIRAAVAVSQNDLASIIQFSSHAIENLSPLNLTVLAAAKWSLGYAYQMQGDYKMARQLYADVLKSSQSIDHFIVTILASIGLGNVFESENQLQMAKKAYSKVLDLTGHQSFPASAVAYLGLSHIAYQENCIKEAITQIQKAIQLAEQLNNMDTLAVCEIFYAKLMLSQGQVNGCLKLLNKASQSLYENNLSNHHYKMAQVEVLTRLYLRDITSAAHIALKYDLPLEQVRVELAAGHADAAISFLESMRENSSIEVLVLKALSFFQADDVEQALTPLLKALDISRKEGYIRIFLDEGKPMKALLTTALQQGIMTEHIKELLAHFSIKEPLAEPLTERELEVLQLITQGLSNEAIGKSLFVSLNTIKGHNQRIFSKLQVKSRTEAVLRAQELRLFAK